MLWQTSTRAIALRGFLDTDLDLYGWYALGHHDPATFFDAVSTRAPNASFVQQDVQLGWAAFRANGFDFVTRSIPGFQPITVIAWSGNHLIDF